MEEFMRENDLMIIERCIENKNENSSHSPGEEEYTLHLSDFVNLPQSQCKEPLLHDEMEPFMNGKGFSMRNPEVFHIAAGVQKEPSIIIEA